MNDDERRTLLQRLGARNADLVEQRLYAAAPDGFYEQDERTLLQSVVTLHAAEPALFRPEAALNLTIRRKLMQRGR